MASTAAGLPQSNLETGLFVNDQEYVAYGFKLRIDATQSFGVQLTAYGASSGNNVPKQPLTGIGVYATW